MSDHWTGKHVRIALIEAYKILQETERRVGNVGVKGYWPDIPVSEDEMWFSVWTDANINYQKQRNARKQRTSFEIAQMDRALLGYHNNQHGPVTSWVHFLSGMSGYRHCLFTFAVLRSQGRRVKPFVTKRKLSYSTFNRQRDKGAEEIARRLNEIREPLWR